MHNHNIPGYPKISINERMITMAQNHYSTKNTYDDDNIPEIDLPGQNSSVEPLPESTRPRKDGPGGDGQ